MPKTSAESRKWRGVTGQCWKLADKLNVVAEDVRYADKPADLTYPMHQLIVMYSVLGDTRGGWLEWYLGLDPKRRGRWPKV